MMGTSIHRLLLLAPVLLAGCITIGDAARLEEARKVIKPGVTTKQEMMRRLGEPNNIVEQAGYAHWNYKYINIGVLPGTQSQTKFLIVTFPTGSDIVFACEFRADNATNAYFAMVPKNTMQRRCDEW